MTSLENAAAQIERPPMTSEAMQEVAMLLGRVKGDLYRLMHVLPDDLIALIGKEKWFMHDALDKLSSRYKGQTFPDATNTPHPLDAVEEEVFLRFAAGEKALTDEQLAQEIERLKKTEDIVRMDPEDFDTWIRTKGIPAFQGLPPIEYIRWGHSEIIEQCLGRLAHGIPS